MTKCLTCGEEMGQVRRTKRYCGSQKEKGSCSYEALLAANTTRQRAKAARPIKKKQRSSRAYDEVQEWLNE